MPRNYFKFRLGSYKKITSTLLNTDYILFAARFIDCFDSYFRIVFRTQRKNIVTFCAGCLCAVTLCSDNQLFA